MLPYMAKDYKKVLERREKQAADWLAMKFTPQYEMPLSQTKSDLHDEQPYMYL